MTHRSRRLAVMGLFVALMCVSAFVRIPVPSPIGITYLTLQTSVAILAALVLMPSEACVVMTVYLALGLVGLPVFSNPGYAGLGYMVCPTFGYLIGFILGSTAGAALRRFATRSARYSTGHAAPNGYPLNAPASDADDAPRASRTLGRDLLAGLLVVAIVFACGIAYAWSLARWIIGAPVAFASLLSASTAFLAAKDAVMAALIASIAPRVRAIVGSD